MAKVIKLVGEIDSWGYMAYQIQNQLSNTKKGDAIELQIDSLGGDVAQAKTIQNMIKSQGNVTAHIVGYTASAATWVALGANKVIMNEDVLMLIHQTSSDLTLYQSVNADDLTQIIAELQKTKKDNEAFDLSIAQSYVRHSKGKLDVKSALNLMKDAAWLTPDDALKYGLVDEISNEKNMQIVDSAISKKIMNTLKMPAIPIQQPIEQEPEKKNMVTAIKDALTQVFGGSVANIAPAEAPKVQSEKDNTIMKKDYVKVNTLLNVEGIEVKDGNITLTEDQVKSINDALAAKDAKVDELNKSLDTAKADKKTADDALSNAEKTIDTISDDIKSTDGLAGKVDKIKTIMNHVAGVQIDTPAAEHDPEDCSDVAHDPVNDMVAPYLHRNTKK